MFAIVEIAGQQFKIDQGTKTLRVPFMAEAEVGQSVSIDRVLVMADDNGKVKTGGNAAIAATVAGHTRGEKVIVFHKKRRKGYRKTNGHTPKFTELTIEKFGA